MLIVDVNSIPALTHEAHLIAIVHEWDVEDEASEYKQDRVDILKLWILNNRSYDQICRDDQNQDGNDERHLQRLITI